MYTILFADEQIVIAEDQQDIKYMLNKLVEECCKWRNTQKTHNIWLLAGRNKIYN